MTITEIKADLAEKIKAETGENVFLCYQCLKCTVGCPMASYFDLEPNQVLRAAQLGLDDAALNAKTPWLCASCQTCTTRCPNGIDVARVMDFLVTEALSRGMTPKVPEVALFNKVFLRNVNILGRAYELGLILEMNLRTGQPFKDVPMGLEMMTKGKVNLAPAFVRPPRHAKSVQHNANQVAYYPGCSLHSLASEYNHSSYAVAGALGLELVELEKWVCCGSSSAHRIDPQRAVELPLRNLALVEQMEMDEVALPCPACYSRFRAAQHETTLKPALKEQFAEKTGYTGQREIAVHTLLEVMVNRIGLEAIAAKTTRPLSALKVVCYYGCLLTRPPFLTGSDDPEYPLMMDRLLTAIGATPVDWGSRTSCCGGSISGTQTDIVIDFSGKILDDARAAGADAIVVACPLCHMNLDGRQHQILHAQAKSEAKKAGREIPVLYFTQLMALAFGLGEKAASISKNMINPKPLLSEKGCL